VDKTCWKSSFARRWHRPKRTNLSWSQSKRLEWVRTKLAALTCWHLRASTANQCSRKPHRRSSLWFESSLRSLWGSRSSFWSCRLSFCGEPSWLLWSLKTRLVSRQTRIICSSCKLRRYSLFRSRQCKFRWMIRLKKSSRGFDHSYSWSLLDWIFLRTSIVNRRRKEFRNCSFWRTSSLSLQLRRKEFHLHHKQNRLKCNCGLSERQRGTLWTDKKSHKWQRRHTRAWVR